MARLRLPPPSPWWICLGLAAVVAVYLHQVRAFWPHTNDDAYITLRYSRFLAAGHGPYFNVGEHVEGYTNFLLMVLLALVVYGLGPGAAPVAAKAISVLFGLLSVVLSFAFVRYALRRSHGETNASLWALGAAGIVAVSPAYAVNSTNGLETTLLAFELVAAVGLAAVETQRRQWLGSGLFWGLAVLTRPEASLLFAVFWLARCGLALKGRFVMPERKLAFALGTDAVVVTAVFAAQTWFRHRTYDGEWLPNTYYAKAGGFMGSPPLEYIAEGILPPVLGLAGIVLAIVGLFLRRDVGKTLLPLGVVTAAGCLLPIFTGSDWMMGWRLLMPY